MKDVLMLMWSHNRIRINSTGLRSPSLYPFFRVIFMGIFVKKAGGGGGLTPPGKFQIPNHFGFWSYLVGPSIWPSFIEIGEMACITTAWSSHGHALKPPPPPPPPPLLEKWRIFESKIGCRWRERMQSWSSGSCHRHEEDGGNHMIVCKRKVAVEKPDTGLLFKAIRFKKKARQCTNFSRSGVRWHRWRCWRRWLVPKSRWLLVQCPIYNDVYNLWNLYREQKHTSFWIQVSLWSEFLITI